MELKEQLKEIKTQLRLSMNGAVSQSMREKGLVYKLNFGVELPRIKSIASAYGKDHALAQALWKEDIRECKILAGLLQPVDSFLPEIADIWVENIRNIEIAELTCMNLFQHLPYAPAKSFHWIAAEDEYTQVCGFLTIARLLMKKGDIGVPLRLLSCAQCRADRYPPLHAAQRGKCVSGLPQGRRHGRFLFGDRTAALQSGKGRGSVMIKR